MNRKGKRLYEAPVLTVVSFKTERGYASSGASESSGSGLLGSWFGSDDAWSGSSSGSGSGSSTGSWTDNGGNAWE